MPNTLTQPSSSFSFRLIPSSLRQSTQGMAGPSPICFGSFRFPREVEYAIIDHLADDSPTLASCALVCRAWRSPSQSLNLRSVTLRVTDTSDAILFEFLRFLKPAPEAATHIRSLQIHGGGPSHARHTTIWLTTLRKYLSLLPRLKQLTFCFISFLYDLQDSDPSWLYAHGCPPPGRPCVDMVSLTECKASTRDLIELFFMFSGINHLRISGGEWPNVQSGSILLPRSSHRTPAVRALTLGAVVPETLCALIRNPRSPNGNVASTLRVLRLLPPKASEPESLLGAFRTYLTHFTRCLVELHLNACALVEQAHSLSTYTTMSFTSFSQSLTHYHRCHAGEQRSSSVTKGHSPAQFSCPALPRALDRGQSRVPQGI